MARAALFFYTVSPMSHYTDDIFKWFFFKLKMYEFRLRFHYFFLRVHWQYFSIGSDNGLGPARRQAIIWTNDGWFTDAYNRHSAPMG